MHTAFTILQELSTRKIPHEIMSVRDGYMMFVVPVPGERWEIEVSVDGDVEIEIFRSDGAIHGEDWMKRLFDRYSE